MPVLRAVAIPAFAGTWRNAWTKEMLRCADAANSAAVFASRAATDVAIHAARAAAFAADSGNAAFVEDAGSLTAPLGAARAADAAFAPDIAEAAYSAYSADAEHLIEASDQTIEALLKRLMMLPLWHGDAPKGILENWERLKASLPSDEDWWVWTDWYEARLTGWKYPAQPLIFELERDRISIPEDDWNHPDNPAHVNGIIAGLEEKYRLPSTVPEQQQPGLQFGVSESGRIETSNSGVPDDDDLSQLGGFREVLIEVAGDLEDLCNRSNAFKFLERPTKNYLSEWRKDTREISLDKLHAYGLIFQSARDKARKDIEADLLPDMEAPVEVAIEAVLAIHGPALAGTRRVRELIRRPNPLADPNFSESEYKAATKTFVSAIRSEQNLLEEDAMEDVTALNEAVETTVQPGVTLAAAKTANANFLIKVSRIAVEWIAKPIAGAVVVSVAGTAISAVEYQALAEACIRFLSSNIAPLNDLIGASGSDLAWLRPVLDWLKRRK